MPVFLRASPVEIGEYPSLPFLFLVTYVHLKIIESIVSCVIFIQIVSKCCFFIFFFLS